MGGAVVIVVVWIAEIGWRSVVDVARELTPQAEIVLVHVIPGDVEEVVHGAFAGLLGRHRSAPTRVDEAAAEDERQLLAAAAARLDRPATLDQRRGRVEREIVDAAAKADLLVLSRDGDRSRLGPHSLRPHTRFVVDHAPCAVLLVWPGSAPAVDTIPPPPDHAHPPDHPGAPTPHPPPPPHHPPPPG
jgi:nucleotide-binding universal stress UspA family protein